MARKRKGDDEDDEQITDETDGDEGNDDVVMEGTIVCSISGEHRVATPQEETTQSLIDQLHREYGVAFEDMARDVRIGCEYEDPRSGKIKQRSRAVSLVVYEAGAAREPSNIIRVAMIAKPGTKAEEKHIDALDEVLGNLSDKRDPVFGLWTNGADLEFRMRSYDPRSGRPKFASLADFPAPSESLADLQDADRKPLRIASGDSLLRTFKRCHDYLYGNQNMRGDKAFWQLLYLIFCKIYDEEQSRRRFFVGATEAFEEKGQKAAAKRIRDLFTEVKRDVYADVFDGNERIELNERALAYVASELGRYSLLSTDTDAKGLAYEAITANTLKKERGQFFTPRNVIRMMVEMLDPQPGMKVLDPACGSGGFLVVTLAHLRKRLLREQGFHPDVPVPSELKKVSKPLKKLAEKYLFGIDVDTDLRKAARMNMVMNNDGHGNMFSFNSLEYGVADRRTHDMEAFEQKGGGHGKFDFVFTNPPFGSKIPVSDPKVLEAFDLGHSWALEGKTWVKGKRQKKVPPEILFIEACCKFLKPGSGTMAVVLPNGILGNPGENMEAVRAWVMRHMELVASIDLPVEAFLPQVWIGASCVLLRRRSNDELRLLGDEKPRQGPVFMALAQHCGHGRRGEARYARKADGSDDIRIKPLVERVEVDGRIVETRRRVEVRELADDMPWIAAQYARFRRGQELESE